MFIVIKNIVINYIIIIKLIKKLILQIDLK